MKILITGASGFLGSALALHWLNAGHQIALLLRPSSQLKRLRGLENFFNICRYTNDDEVSTFIGEFKPEIVVHTACSYGRKNETSLQIFDTNLRLGMVILQALESAKLTSCFINTGSALLPEVSLYALSKNQFGQWVHMLAKKSNGSLIFVNVLLQQIYGPGDSKSKFTAHVLNACLRSEPVLELTAGEQLRDFLYIEDAVNAYDILINKYNEFDSGQDVEVGSGNAPSIREFVERTHRLTNSKTKLIFGALPYRENEPMLCRANIERIVELGWQPQFDLESGLKKTIEKELKSFDSNFY